MLSDRERAMMRHPAGGVILCSLCGEPLVAGSYTQVGNQFFHNGGSVFTEDEPDCYRVWSGRG